MTKRAFALRLLCVWGVCLIVAGCTDPEVKKVRHLERGDALLSSGKPAEAALEYRSALKIDQDFAEARFQLAQAFEKTGNPQAAREYIRAAERLPARADVQIKAAALLLADRQHEQARKHADLAIKADPRSMEAQLIRAYALAGLKDMEGAIQELEQIIESSPGDYRPYTTLGNVEALSGNPTEAEAAFKKAVRIDPSSVAPKLALAYLYLSTRRLPEAEGMLLEVISRDERNVNGNRLLALVYLSTQRTEKAEAPLQRLAGQKDPRATLMLANLYAGTNRVDQARQLYESLKSEDATREIAVRQLATLDYRAGRKVEAIAVLDAQLVETPKSVALLSLKSQWLAREGRKRDALETAKLAVAAGPQSSIAQHTLGVAHAANRNHEAAIAAHKEALRLEPNLTASQTELSRLLLATGQPDQALLQARAALKGAPGSTEVRLTLARAMFRNGDFRGAQAEVGTLVQRFPDSSAVHALNGQVLMALSDSEGAIREFDRALALDPADVEALVGRLVIDLARKRPDDGRARVARAIAKAPGNDGLLITAARFERSDGNLPAAESYLKKAIELQPASLGAYTLLAQLYIAQNRLDEGKRELDGIVARKPDAFGARTMIGMIQQMQGRSDDAVKTYEAIVKENGRAAVAANNLAYLYTESGSQLDQAIQLAQSAKQQMPENPDVSDTLGWAYYKKGMADLAIKPLEFSVQKDPDNPLYLVHLGLAYAKAGRTEKARTALTRALKLKADIAGAEEARAVLASLSIEP